ncbi:MAG: hypothetical protein ACO1N0_12800 [Fluviicola sp.]
MYSIKIIYLTSILVAGFLKEDTPDQEPTHSNSYYSIFSGYNEAMNDVDSVIVLDKHGKRNSYALKKGGIGDYPFLYKDRLISIIYRNGNSDVITFSLTTNKIDTICSNVQLLQSSFIDEYDGKVVVRDTDTYTVLDIGNKKIIKRSKCYLENILLTESGYFLIRTLDNISEPKPYLCAGTLDGETDTKLIDIPDMGSNIYMDATTLGWNGMKVHEGILFIHTFHKILAYDIQQNKIIDEIAEEKTVSFQVNKAKNPVFRFEDEYQIVFNLKNKRFKHS